MGCTRGHAFGERRKGGCLYEPLPAWGRLRDPWGWVLWQVRHATWRCYAKNMCKQPSHFHPARNLLFGIIERSAQPLWVEVGNNNVSSQNTSLSFLRLMSHNYCFVTYAAFTIVVLWGVCPRCHFLGVSPSVDPCLIIGNKMYYHCCLLCCM